MTWLLAEMSAALIAAVAAGVVVGLLMAWPARTQSRHDDQASSAHAEPANGASSAELKELRTQNAKLRDELKSLRSATLESDSSSYADYEPARR